MFKGRLNLGDGFTFTIDYEKVSCDCNDAFFQDMVSLEASNVTSCGYFPGQRGTGNAIGEALIALYGGEIIHESDCPPLDYSQIPPGSRIY